jgi:hypothetical protein
MFGVSARELRSGEEDDEANRYRRKGGQNRNGCRRAISAGGEKLLASHREASSNPTMILSPPRGGL